MKFMLIISAFFVFNRVEAQVSIFNYSDSVFKAGSIHIINIDHGWYDINKSFNKAEYKNALVIDSAASFLTKNKNLIVEIGSHSGIRPTVKYCFELTKRRAESLRQELVERGIEGSGLISKGYGKEKPVYNNKQIAEIKSMGEKEKAHLKNDRIELKILEIK